MYGLLDRKIMFVRPTSTTLQTHLPRHPQATSGAAAALKVPQHAESIHEDGNGSTSIGVAVGIAFACAFIFLLVVGFVAFFCYEFRGRKRRVKGSNGINDQEQTDEELPSYSAAVASSRTLPKGLQVVTAP